MTERSPFSAARPARILIVDDEPFNVDYLEQELECRGFITEAATDGLEALERVAAAPPDLVLLDVMMPRMDGISTLRILKDDPETRLIPVVLMTALNAVEDRVRGIEAGADDFLSKPVDDRELLARINTALNLKRAIDETVGELRTTSAHLERYGRQERDVAVLAIEWRLGDTSLPEEALGFVGRRRRVAAEERIRALGGIATESDASLLVAVFDGPDVRARSLAAIEAALAILGEDPPVAEGASPKVAMTAAISVGPAQVGSTRVTDPGGSRWLFRAEGEPVELAADLARKAVVAGVLVVGDAAGAVSSRFTLEPVSDGAFRVRVPTPGAVEAGGARLPSDRRIRTILVTDIVDSTRTAERIGDRAWGELTEAHERATRAELALFGGEEIDTTGDGFIAFFDSSASAIRCAFALLDRLATLGLTIRAGVHTGEVDQVEGSARGIALHVADRVIATAKPGEVLVSGTTRELAAGAGLDFTDRGEHTLKGVSEPKRLYAATEGRGERSPNPATPEPNAEARATAFPAGLTAREVEVLGLVAIGLSDAEIAKRLFLSVRTVNAHVRSIYRKTGVRSRAAAGRFAEEHGLL